MLDLGSVAHVVVAPTDTSGNPADVTTLAAVVTLPDGTTTSGSATRVSLGQYTFDYTTVQAGRHLVSLTGTGGAGGPFTYTEVFNVWPTDPGFIFGLADAKRAINSEWSMSTVDDGELRLFMAATTDVIEDICGPVVYRSFTATYSGGAGRIILPGPATNITVVTENGVTISDVLPDAADGILMAGNTFIPRPFLPGTQNVTVTYFAGFKIIPSTVILAATEEFRFLWENGQQGNPAQFGGVLTGVHEAATPSGYAVPPRVVELCGPYAVGRGSSQKLPGIA